ncbi:GAF and ANTAR domain-containing protein [Jatrophihabitans telluris]|uniref:GAF and ANTAR domain-containing protein n=1 Tax=Jatrophihabitans telluris TaxID=2038343 RepID=A0ABY4QT51_9ACTN|nr:GAF and ANTAR domain-containing protein [Jatrophihabitans telluris]UQX86870.1 GAF and ANTAR domain-containing protein [Jatrophihabitans telluris]
MNAFEQPTPYSVLSTDFASLARDLARQPSLDATLRAIVRYALTHIEGAEDAGVTMKLGENSFRTVGATGDVPQTVDAIQYQMHEGPCIDSLHKGHVFRSDGIADDPRWPRFGPLAAEKTAIVSILSHRLFIEDDEVLGSLNVYSTKPAAFARLDLTVLDALATHSAIALAKANAETQAASLETALRTNRRIGMAVGVLIALYKVTDDQAFDLLRMASQHQHRKLRDVADDVIATGELEL